MSSDSGVRASAAYGWGSIRIEKRRTDCEWAIRSEDTSSLERVPLVSPDRIADQTARSAVPTGPVSPANLRFLRSLRCSVLKSGISIGLHSPEAQRALMSRRTRE
jgi:hypothetical protein